MITRANRAAVGAASGFTLIEIAICIAIVAFSLTAILGVLPSGMTVQKDNREDTVINQDGQFLIEVLRGGPAAASNALALAQNLVSIEYFTNNILSISATSATPAQIVGTLCRPTYEVDTNGVIVTTNSVRAQFVANNSALSDRSATSRDLAFGYLLGTELVPFGCQPVTNATPLSPMLTPSSGINLSTNLYELRLTLRWPVLSIGTNVTIGNGRKVFRTLLSGRISTVTNAFGDKFSFFEPNLYQSGT